MEQVNVQMASIREMVAALECDYDRLEELREERQELQDAISMALDEKNEAAENVIRHHGAPLTEGDYPEIVEYRECLAAYAAAVDAMGEWEAHEGSELDELASQAGDCEDSDQARQRIEEDALCVEVRSDWHTPGEESEPAEFKILLCTGGPHVEIRGELSRGEPSRAWLVSCDWGTSMQERCNQAGDQDALLTYAACFFY